MRKKDRESLDAALDAANRGQEPIRRWIARIAQYGVTNSLVSDLNRILRNVEVSTWPVLKKRGKSAYIGLGDMYDHLELPRPDATEETAALWISRLLSIDALTYLRRCKAEDCRKYFVRGPKAEWCSDNCGGRVRNAKKRKRDRQHGAMI